MMLYPSSELLPKVSKRLRRVTLPVSMKPIIPANTTITPTSERSVPPRRTLAIRVSRISRSTKIRDFVANEVVAVAIPTSRDCSNVTY